MRTSIMPPRPRLLFWLVAGGLIALGLAVLMLHLTALGPAE